MIQINEAVLHIFDYSHGSLVLSDALMSSDDRAMLHFVSKQIDKLLHSPAIKQGNFESFSTFQTQVYSYEQKSIDLLELSKSLAKTWYHAVAESDKIDPAALLVCDVHDNANHYLVALKYKNKNGYQFINREQMGKRINMVVENESILPGASNSIEECFLIHLDTMRVYFKDIRRVIQSEDVFVIPTRLLQCTQELSCKEVIQTIQQLGDSFCDTYDLDPIQIQSRTKGYLQKQLQDDGYLHTADLSSYVFAENAVMASEFMSETKQMHIPESMRLHEQFASSKSKRQRMKLDNGIELLLPAMYYDDPDVFEMVKNEDNSVDIILKNIKKIK